MEPTSRNDWLTQITGKSVSEYRQQLVQFGNQVEERRRATQVIQQPASLIKVSSAILPTSGFMRPILRKFTRNSKVCCLGLPGSGISVKFSGLSPNANVISYTGVNGTFDAPGGPTDADCAWGSVFQAYIFGSITYQVILGDPSTEQTSPVYLLMSCNFDDTLSVDLTCNEIFFIGNIFNNDSVTTTPAPNFSDGTATPGFTGGTFEIL